MFSGAVKWEPASSLFPCSPYCTSLEEWIEPGVVWKEGRGGSAAFSQVAAFFPARGWIAKKGLDPHSNWPGRTGSRKAIHSSGPQRKHCPSSCKGTAGILNADDQQRTDGVMMNAPSPSRCTSVGPTRWRALRATGGDTAQTRPLPPPHGGAPVPAAP